MTDQERAKEKAVRELACWLGPVTNLRDPEAGAAKFIDWLEANGWYHRESIQDFKPEPPNPEAAHRGADYARDLLNIRKDDHA